MQVNIHTPVKDLTGLMIFDFLHAWLQRLNLDRVPEYNYTLCDPGHVELHGINILYLDIHARPFPWNLLDQADFYDLIFVDNHADPLLTSSEVALDIMNRYSHAYMVIDSYLDPQHPWADRYIPVLQDHYATKLFWNDPKYPTSYAKDLFGKIDRCYDMIYINGANRSYRQYAIDLLQEQIPDIKILNTYKKLVPTDYSFFESSEDTAFKEFVNARYQEQYNTDLDEKSGQQYYQEGVTIGSHGKFGQVVPGYVMMKEYFEYRCVIFPDSTWQNNELALTEKAWKCFYSGSMPMPLGGANIYKLYNQFDVYTAWNLLPEELKQFDSVLDHQLRYQGFARAVKWLHDHPHVLTGSLARDYTEHNYRQFFSNVTHAKTSEILYNVLMTVSKK